MRGLCRTVLAICLIMSALPHLPAHARSELFDPNTMMPVSEIRRGMQAVSKTVFQGVEITEFNLEILGILEKADLGHDIILARVLDGPIIQRQSGIIAGMSGSPVYINGRLIGAIAYRWAFEREPIAGITTIDAMLGGFENLPTTDQTAASARGAIVGGRYVTKMQVVSHHQSVKFTDTETLAMQPVAPLISCAGFSSNAMKHLRGFFDEYGLKAVVGPGAMGNPVDTELVPGAPVGVQLVAGDFDISAAGTVTYRDGDRLLAFGHPMMKLGQTQIPVTTAWVHDIMPGLDFSYRFSSSMKPVGTMLQDTGWSIAARLGEPPGMIPAVFTIHNQDTGISRNFDLQVANNKAITGFLLTTCALSTIEAAYDAGAEGMVEVSFTVEGKEGARISRRNISYYTGDPSFAVLMELMSAISLLEENRFQPQQIMRVTVEATINNQDETAFIEDVYAEEPVARAGEPVVLHVLLRPDSGELVDKIIKLPMPLDLPKSKLRIAVGGGSGARRYRARVGLLLPEFAELASLIEDFETQERANQLLVAAGIPIAGLRIGPVRLNNLPESVRDGFAVPSRSNIAVGFSELSVSQDTPWVIYGDALLVLPTEDRTGARAKVAVPTKPSVTPLLPEQIPSPLAAYSREGIAKSLWWAASALRPQAAWGLSPGERSSWLPDFTEKPNEADTEEPTEAETPEKTENEEEEEEPEKDEGKVVRQPSVWSQTSAEDFQTGELRGVGIGSRGSLILAPQWEELHRFTDELIRTMVVDSGNNLYLGATGGGQVYKFAGQQLDKYYETDQFAVTALAVDTDGTLYAGTAPDGQLFAITAQDEGKLLCELPADYIWDLELANDGHIWAATGPEGIIYQVDKDGQFSVYTDLPQSHVLTLASNGDGLWAGTSQPGCVYRIARRGQAVSLLEIDDSDITSLTVTETGQLYAASAPKGYIYRIGPDDKVTKVYEDKANGVYALLATGGEVYAGTQPQGRILSILDDQHYTIIHQDEKAGPILSLAASTDGTVYAAGSNPAQLLSGRLAEAGTFTSAILDAKRPSQWGRIRWVAEGDEDGRITARCRSGNSTDPDDGTWSVWSRPYGSGECIDIPPARYLQYRFNIQRSADKLVPRIDRVAINYLPANRRPTLKVKQPEEGAALHETVEVKWDADDSDEDTLSATIYLRPAGQTEWEEIAGPLQESSYELDTTTKQPGQYDLKITVSDEPSNPQTAKSTELVLRGMILDNEEPTLRLGEVSRPGEEDMVVIAGSAFDKHSGVAGVSWQANGDDNWYGAAAADGMYGDSFESFTIRTTQVAAEATKLLVRAWDRAGNVADETVELPWAAENGEESEEAEAVEELPQESGSAKH